jgi:hypothetical protein
MIDIYRFDHRHLRLHPSIYIVVTTDMALSSFQTVSNKRAKRKIKNPSNFSFTHEENALA